MSTLTKNYDKEQKQYYLLTSQWMELNESHQVGEPAVIKEYVMKTCTFADSLGVEKSPFEFAIDEDERISGFAGWFNSDFNYKDSAFGDLAAEPVVLSTGPENGYTHWGQQVFYLKDGLDCEAGDIIKGDISLVRQKGNQRLYDIVVSVQHVREGKVLSDQNMKYDMP